MAWIVLVLCVIPPLLCSIPAVQKRLATYVSEVVKEELGIQLTVKRMHPSLDGRLVLDDVTLLDRFDSVALHASRIAAKVDPISLADGRIRIRGAQLLSADVSLYKMQTDSALNIQNIINALSSNDTTPSRINLAISSLVLRHCTFRYNVWDKPITPGHFNANHIGLENVSLTADLRSLTPSAIDVAVRRLTATDHSGLTLKNFAFECEADTSGMNLRNLLLQMPSSQLSIPSLQARYAPYSQKAQDEQAWLNSVVAEGQIGMTLMPSDLRSLSSSLEAFNDVICLKCPFTLKTSTLQSDNLELYDSLRHFQMESKAIVRNLWHKPQADVQLHHFIADAQFPDFLSANLNLHLPDALKRIGDNRTTGTLHYADSCLQAMLETNTQVGELSVDAKLVNRQTVEATLDVNSLRLGQLLNSADAPEELSLQAHTLTSLPKKGEWPVAHVEVILPQVLYKGQSYKDIRLSARSQAHSVEGNLKVEHESVDLTIDASLERQDKAIHLKNDAHIKRFSPSDCGLTAGFKGETFGTHLRTDVTYLDAEHIRGEIQFDSLFVENDTLGRYELNALDVFADYTDDVKRISLQSRPLTAKLDGDFRWAELAATAQQILHNYLPTFVKAPNKLVNDNELTFNVQLQDTTILHRLAGIPLRVPEPLTLRGQVDGRINLLNVALYSPQLHYGNELLREVNFASQTTGGILHTTLQGRRSMKKGELRFDADLFASDHQLRTRFNWDNERHPQSSGTLALTGFPYKDAEGNQAIRAVVDHTEMYVGDTLWHIQPAAIDYHDGRIDVDGLGLSSGARYLSISGVASSLPQDSLIVDLHEVDVSYVLDLVNFHSVEFDGEASGRIYATQVLKQPHVNAFLHVADFTFNEALLGQMDVYGSFGDRGKSIYLDANIQDLPTNQFTSVKGDITLGKGDGTGLNLNINTQRINLAFLNSFTQGIMSNVTGSASGWARLFGPFKTIDLEGDMMINEARMDVDVLGLQYRLENDSVRLRPGLIQVRGARVYDFLGSPGQTDHLGVLDGELRHQYLGHWTYDMRVNTSNLLCYNRPTLGNDSFCAVAYTTGAVRLLGGPGRMEVNINVTPTSGSILTYNATQPDKITEANFIRYKKPATDDAEEQTQAKPVEETSSDIYLNFDLNVTPEFTLKVIMDNRSGDNVTLTGNGHMRATFFNKGRFQLYGTYHVNQGLYDLSIQDFLHKEFKFQPSSTIIFGGSPSQAMLNLQAAYTVPNVSLDDLSTTSLGLSNTRVDCIMNITGQPQSPRVAFDFELPTASEEERQMVRSMLSTEEERNMQVIYLLGIGRFFSYNNTNEKSSSQSQLAVNSLVGSTLSSQFNRVLSSAIGNSNWNFGTNVRPGQLGWNTVDVEGMLSGRLFNNRLLINGNFGYRERIYNTSNFIGDFDVQYLLTKTGSISLKAYNKSNDRYFIQSSLNTQGIGVQLKKDFQNFLDIFRRTKPVTVK